MRTKPKAMVSVPAYEPTLTLAMASLSSSPPRSRLSDGTIRKQRSAYAPTHTAALRTWP